MSLPADDMIMDTNEVAEFLGVSARTVRRWRQEALAGNKAASPRWSRVGERCRYRHSDVENWIDARRVDA